MTARAAQDSGVSGLSGRLVEVFAAGSYTAYASVTTASDGSFVIAYPFGERTSPGLAGSGEGHGPDKMSGSELWRCGTESESLDQASSGGGGWGRQRSGVSVRPTHLAAAAQRGPDAAWRGRGHVGLRESRAWFGERDRTGASGGGQSFL